MTFIIAADGVSNVGVYTKDNIGSSIKYRKKKREKSATKTTKRRCERGINYI